MVARGAATRRCLKDLERTPEPCPMRRPLLLLALVACLGLTPAPPPPPPGGSLAPCMSRRAHGVPAAYADAVARARAVVCELLASGMPGIQVAVGVDGRLVWSEGFGYADVERRTPVSPESQFRIGSVSKP